VQPYEPHAPVAPQRPAVDARTLWSGGVAAALVAALIAVLGIVVARGLFHIPVLAPKGKGTFGDASTWQLALAAAVAALLATALLHILLLSTPRPFSFFGWIITLATAVVVLIPFSLDAPIAAKVATGVINLLIGIAIGTLVSSVGARSLRRQP
jgi:drug/metabolite transporter (DMT)-like permease